MQYRTCNIAEWARVAANSAGECTRVWHRDGDVVYTPEPGAEAARQRAMRARAAVPAAPAASPRPPPPPAPAVRAPAPSATADEAMVAALTQRTAPAPMADSHVRLSTLAADDALALLATRRAAESDDEHGARLARAALGGAQ